MIKKKKRKPGILKQIAVYLCQDDVDTLKMFCEIKGYQLGTMIRQWVLERMNQELQELKKKQLF